ncbi:hypothetical protein TrLO_g14312 [Triparma laevis f. longispina]|uniref:Sodium/calcium exchanger membrane region domain-containing protein n=1 Tax=Triparma laevis f. longispina TaxID=1714387 RepID=A0A9W7F9G9_9STRA|nr:hypothetical protein TrLO_g14312 [Triparma laevis f. longispina]
MIADKSAVSKAKQKKREYRRTKRIAKRKKGLPIALCLGAAGLAYLAYVGSGESPELALGSDNSGGGLRGRALAEEGIFRTEELDGRVLSGGGANANSTCELPMLPNAIGGKTTGNVILSAIFTLWAFVGLAIVCDEFFQPSLEAISEALNLSPDVAGATFLAAGSSAPELFTSLADAFGDASSIGMGTIVGSAMFNILVIVALSAAVAGKSGASLKIDYRPVTRDVCFYSYSILLLALFFTDGVITAVESGIMWASYLLYILFMVFNEKILGMCKPPTTDAYKVTPEDDDAADAAVTALQEAGTFKEKGEEGSTEVKKEEVEEEEEEEGESRFALPDSASDWPLFLLSLPFLAMFTVTIPDCGTKKWEKYYVASFVSSILWIGILCHIMVEFAVGIACIQAIDPIVMGVLVLAVGTSVPDAIGSMIAARNGEADMAIANAIGSNVFDVLLGLGFPWFLAILVKGEDFVVCKDGIETAVLILFCTVILFVGVLAINKWMMNTTVGIGLFALYALYVIYTIISAASQGKKCGE